MAIVQEETLVVLYALMPREIVRTSWDEAERRKKFSRRASILFSTESEDTDWRAKSFYSLKVSLVTEAHLLFVLCGQDEKYRRVTFDIIPCVVVTSLETDALVVIVASFDMLMVKGSPARGREKKVLKEQLLFWEKNTSKVVYLKIQIQWIFINFATSRLCQQSGVEIGAKKKKAQGPR